jgi:hypothetical protein
MGQVLYGATLYQRNSFEADFNYDAIGKNSEAITGGDPLTLISGQIAVGGTTNSIIGVAVRTATMASTNVGGANVQPPYIPVDSQTEFLMGTNGDLTGDSTDTGTYYKLTANTTNTVQVDVASGVQTTTNRVVMIKKVDPFNEGGTGSGSGVRKCTVVFVRTPTWIDQ